MWDRNQCRASSVIVRKVVLFETQTAEQLQQRTLAINPLMSTGNYSATSNNMKLVHWPLMGGLLHLVQREGAGRDPSPPRPLLAVPNVTAHRSMASVYQSITVSLNNGPLLCGFSVPINGLRRSALNHAVCAP